MFKKTITFNKTRINATKMSDLRFVFERESDDSYTIIASSEKYGEWKGNVPILNLLELMGGEIKTTIIDEKKPKKKISKKPKQAKVTTPTAPAPATALNNSKKKRVEWDGPHEGYCHKLVKIEGKACYTRFTTLQEAKIEAMKLGSGLVGGITESNGTFSLRVGNSAKSNASSKKKNERSWLFKEVEVEPTNEPDVEPTNEPEVEPTNEQDVEPTNEPDVEQEEISILTETTDKTEDENNSRRAKMIEYINMYSTINSDVKFTCSIWNYKNKTFTVLDDNVIMDNGKFIGMRFYNNGTYDAMFIDEYKI